MIEPLTEILAHRAHDDAGFEAFVVSGQGELTFGAWHAEARAVAASLVARGVRPGDRIATLFGDPEWIGFCVAYMGVLLAGAVAVPLRRPAADTWLRALLEHADVRGLVHGAEPAAAEMPCWTVGVGELTNHRAGSETLPRVELADTASIVLTSGTTATPKAVVCSHAGLTGEWNRSAKPAAGSFLTSVTVGSNAAQATLCSAILNRSRTVLLPEFEPSAFRRAVGEQNVIGVGLTPTLARVLTSAPGEPMPAVRTVVLSSAPVDQPTVAKLATIFPGADVLNAYTLTEGGPSFVARCTPDGLPALGRPDHGEQVRIVDETGADVDDGEVGELLIRSDDSPSRSYLDGMLPAHGDNARGRSTTRFLDDGWIGTGDLCYAGEDGTLFFVGRADDVIISGGFNVSGLTVESVLRTHDAVRDVAVFGVPHPVLGEQVVAAVVLSTPTPFQALRELCAARLRPQERPGFFVEVAELPTGPSGKVLKRVLRDEYSAPARNTTTADPSDPALTGDERMVAEAFERLLEQPSVGRDSNFFELGGHSLAASQVAVELSERTGAAVPAQSVLRFPKVKDLAAWMARRRQR